MATRKIPINKPTRASNFQSAKYPGYFKLYPDGVMHSLLCLAKKQKTHCVEICITLIEAPGQPADKCHTPQILHSSMNLVNCMTLFSKRIICTLLPPDMVYLTRFFYLPFGYIFLKSTFKKTAGFLLIYLITYGGYVVNAVLNQTLLFKGPILVRKLQMDWPKCCVNNSKYESSIVETMLGIY